MGKTSQGTKRIEGTITLKKREAFDLKHCSKANYPMQCLCLTEHLQKHKLTLATAQKHLNIGGYETFRKWVQGVTGAPAYLMPAMVAVLTFLCGKKEAEDFKAEWLAAMEKEMLFRQEKEADKLA